MEPPLLTLVVISLGIFFQSVPLIAVSKKIMDVETLPPPRPSSSTSSPPPRSLSSPPPPPSPSPPSSLSPPPPSSSSPPTTPHPPPSRNYHRRSPPLPLLSSSDTHNKACNGKSKSTSGHGLNLGKKIGLTFLVIATLLQVSVVGFLVIKRRQLFKAYSRQ